jgi:hypothetical protein
VEKGKNEMAIRKTNESNGKRTGINEGKRAPKG